MVHRAVVESLDNHVILIGDPRVVHVDETVCRPGEEYVRSLRRMEAQLRDVVAVHFVILDALCWSIPEVPGDRDENMNGHPPLKLE